MALLPTPAPPSTTSLILSRSAMFSGRLHPDLEHDRENVAASGRHHPGGGRSEFRPPPGNSIWSPHPSRHPRSSRHSSFVRRILIWFPPAIPGRGQERFDGGSSSRSTSLRNDRVFPPNACHWLPHSLTPLTLRSRGKLSHLPRGNRSHSPALRFELKFLLKDDKSFRYYLFTRAEYEILSAGSNYGTPQYNAIWGRQVDWKLKWSSITMDVPS